MAEGGWPPDDPHHNGRYHSPPDQPFLGIRDYALWPVNQNMPLHAGFGDPNDRCRTFHLWPQNGPQSPHELAINGFIHQPSREYPDMVVCHSCGLSLHSWRSRDNPASRHRQLSPNCKMHDRRDWRQDPHEPFFGDVRVRAPPVSAMQSSTSPPSSETDGQLQTYGRLETDGVSVRPRGWATQAIVTRPQTDELARKADACKNAIDYVQSLGSFKKDLISRAVKYLQDGDIAVTPSTLLDEAYRRDNQDIMAAVHREVAEQRAGASQRDRAAGGTPECLSYSADDERSSSSSDDDQPIRRTGRTRRSMRE